LSRPSEDDGDTPPYFRWLVPATILIPALVLLLAGWLNRVEVVGSAQSALLREVGMLREHALKVFETQELLLADMAADVAQFHARGADWGDIAADHQLFERYAILVDRYAQVDGVALVDRSGAVRLTSRVFPAPPIDVRDRDYFHAIIGGTPSFISATYPSKLTGRPQFNFARHILSTDGKLLGLALVSLHPDYLRDFWRRVLDRPGTTAALVREGGAVLASWPGPAQPPLTPAVHQAIRAAEPGPTLLRVERADGEDAMVALAPLPLYGAVVMLSRDMRAVLAPWRRNILAYAGLAIPAAAVLLALALQAARTAARERTALTSLRHEADRRAETARALRESESRYRGYFETALEQLFVISLDPDGDYRFVALNPAVERATGLIRVKAVGRRLQDILTSEASEKLIAHCRASQAAGNASTFEDTLDLPTGRRTFETVLVPLRDEEGRIVEFLGSARDVTERRRADERMVQAQKMETVGQLTGGLAHDFNNLLTAVLNNLRLVRQEPGGGDNPDRIDNAIRAATAGADLVRRLMAFSRRQSLESRPVLVESLIRDILPLVERMVGERVQLSHRIDPDLPPIRVDPVQLENAILNLAVNARDAMPEGGLLGIAARLVPDGTEAGAVRISIADTGTGMTPDVAARVFEPFFTTKPPGQGTGLGLSTVYGFVTQSGGQVRMETDPGRGTTFHLTFPAIRAAVRAAEPEPETAPRPAMSARILVVEDEALVRLSTLDLLRSQGHRPDAVGTAEAALVYLDRHGAVDLLLTDIGLPGMDGRTLARTVRERWPGIPVVLMTGYDRTRTEAGATTGETFPHLDKPYTPWRLARTIAAALAGRPDRDRPGDAEPGTRNGTRP